MEIAQFRLKIAVLLNKMNSEKFSEVVGKNILEMSAVNRKKARYYPNSKIHRIKLRHFQPLVFCSNIQKEVIDELIFELLWINNQLNVIFVLELYIAYKYENIFGLFKLHAKDLNSQALKSLISIAIIQLKSITIFKEAENMLDKIFQNIFPFTMGHNFGVRVYSMLAITLSIEHIQSLSDYVETPLTKMISDIRGFILESVKQKNCLKYFEALKCDFRFSKKLEDLVKPNIFYSVIPNITHMPFEEIIYDESDEFEKYHAADIPKDSDILVTIEEMEMVDNLKIFSVSNLQRKYLPLKNQLPSEKLLKTLPETYKSFNVENGLMVSEENFMKIL